MSCEKSSDALYKFSACKFIKKFRAHFHNLCTQKRSCFLRSSDKFFEFCAFKIYKKCFGCIFKIYASKNEEFCCEWDAFRKCSACEIYKNISGCIFTIFASKLKLFAVEFRCNLEIFALWGWKRKFWAHFHNFCIQKQSCSLWSSNAFFKFSACKVYKKSSGRIFTIYAFKRETLWCEVQKNFGSFHFARFVNKVLGAFLRFMRRKAKLFAAKFRRILEVLHLLCFQRKFWANFHDLCIWKRSCLLWSPDIFWKFSPCKL